MAQNLIKHILSLGFRSSSDISSIVCKSYGCPLATDTSYKFISTQCNRTQPLLQKELTFHKDKPISIPFVQSNDVLKNSAVEDCNVITSTDVDVIKRKETDALAPCTEDVSDIGPFASPSFHLAAYVNTSYTLQQLVQMGVELHTVEKKVGAAESILKLDFEKHVKPHLRFLHDVGVPAEELGKFVTRNPFIFGESLDDLQTRINYLEAKKFTSDGIARIITRSPIWLNFSTVDIDKRLGFFQRRFVLSGNEVRTVAVKRPQLITYNLLKITKSHFAVKEEMGFDEVETKTLLLEAPKLFTISTVALKTRFDYVHNIMGISHSQLLQQPGVMLFRNFIVEQRHEFLKELGKAQYDPKLPNYVSLQTLVHGSDVDFCRNVAKTSIEVFNAFLKAR